MQIPQIKARLTIAQVLDHYLPALKLRQAGGLKPFMINCPFHEDKTPSLQVYPKTNTYHCFGCGQSGDVIQFIQDKEQLTKQQAILKAKKLIGETIIETVNQKHLSAGALAKADQSMTGLNQVFLKMQSLPKSKEANAYLRHRNLNGAELEIGYNDGTSYQGLKNCLVFPLRDESQRIVSLYGRSLSDNGAQRHYYLKDRQGLYPGYLNPETTTVILTESIIDSATIQKYTNYKTLALYGTNGFTAEHEATLTHCKHLQEVILFFDGDPAGRDAMKKYSQQLHHHFPEATISQVETPEGEDPNSLIQSHQPEILNHLIDNRTLLFSTENNLAPGQLDTTPEGSGSSLCCDNPDYLLYQHPPLLISVMGGVSLFPLDKLIVTLRIERQESKSSLHQIRHRLDLYNDDQVEKLMRKTAEKLELGSREVQLAIAQLIETLENYRIALLERTKPKLPEKRLIPADREKTAITFMQRKDYLKQLYELIEKSGVVGERNNSLILWITYATRKREDPLHVICLGASGTGKTYLQERITDLIPEEEKISGTAMSENALYYAQNLNLAHKLFVIEDLEGASNVLYSLREFQTKREISKLVTQKNSKGNLETAQVQSKGPICLTATTTKEKLYEDNANRCLLIYLDGSKAQQEAIMDDQRKRSAGKINKNEQEEIKELLRDMQSLYKPIAIRNPYAEQLKIPETVFKPLRTNSHYLAFIEGITFCMQYQRKTYTDPETGELYINTTIEDIELANQLMKEVLLSKSDELTKACRDFFEGLKADLAREKKTSFYRHEVREWKRINPNNLRYYLRQLTQYGYLNIIGRHKHNGHEYEVSRLEEYQNLNGNLCNVLDSTLEAIMRIHGKKQKGDS